MDKKHASGEENGTDASVYITQPNGKPSRIDQIESEMGMILGGIVIGVIAISSFVIYINLPEEETAFITSQVASFFKEARREPIKVSNAESSMGQEAALSKSPSPPVPEGKEPIPDASPTGAAEITDKADASLGQWNAELPSRPEAHSGGVTADTADKKPSTPPSSSPGAAPAAVAVAKSIDPKAPAASGKQLARAKKVIALDRSIGSEKVPNRSKPGCNLDRGAKNCSPRYVVTFKRFWGPVLEERAYPNLEMSRRAQALWDREGKILEADGSINEHYAVKPKAFSPIPGHPAS